MRAQGINPKSEQVQGPCLSEMHQSVVAPAVQRYEDAKGLNGVDPTLQYGPHWRGAILPAADVLATAFMLLSWRIKCARRVQIGAVLLGDGLPGPPACARDKLLRQGLLQLRL